MQWLEKRAIEYRKNAVDSINRNRHMNTLGGKCSLSQQEIDALLTDFINACGVNQEIDFALYTKDLEK